MFTGIIEETGIIEKFAKLDSGAKLSVQCSKILEGVKIGDSICVDGVCQTVTEYNQNSFSVLLSNETLNITNYKNAKSGDIVNLERALTPNSRLGGHIVSGHVDCTGKLVKIEKFSDFYNLSFETADYASKYIVYKGSITINGISLTVAKIDNNIFTVAVIPHTYQNTNLKKLKNGDNVNIETDILAKYIEKIIKFDDNKSNISMEFLKDNGFA
ncbi:riboflavin synthase [bacterium]|nr:riboflavin synthase [bacterium]